MTRMLLNSAALLSGAAADRRRWSVTPSPSARKRPQSPRPPDALRHHPGRDDAAAARRPRVRLGHLTRRGSGRRDAPPRSHGRRPHRAAERQRRQRLRRRRRTARQVKGRGRVAVRFTRITPAGDDDRYTMRTRSWVAVAPATKKKDALTIGLPAAGGAAIGALVDGKKGAGIGALAGGGAGTAVVLTTRGKDVRVNRAGDARGRDSVRASTDRWSMRVD